MIPTPQTVDDLDNLISRPTPGVIETVRSHSGRFAVLGASGKMGFHFCLMLQRALQELDRNESVVAVSRFTSLESKTQFNEAGFEVVAADLSNPAEVATLPHFENVFYLAGVKFGTAEDPDLLTRMNVDMPKLVAEHFQQSRIVALSTGCVYSFTSPESGGSVEDSETNPPGNYAQSCKGREAAFCDAAEQYGTRSSLIRLNYSIDLRYGVLVDIAQKVLAGVPVNVETGHVNVIWQGDAVAHSIQSLSHVSDPPFVLNVTGTDTVMVRDIAELFAKRFGCEASIQGTEQATAWLNNPTKSHALFGKPTHSIEQMIDWIAEWLKAGGATLNKPTHFETRNGSY